MQATMHSILMPNLVYTGAPGVAADLSHINTPSIAEGFGPDNDGLAKALKGSEASLIREMYAASG